MVSQGFISRHLGSGGGYSCDLNPEMDEQNVAISTYSPFYAA
jgi:hypothetical protein